MKSKIHSGSLGIKSGTLSEEKYHLYFCLFEKIGPTSLLALDKNYFYYTPGDKLSILVLEDDPVEIDTIKIAKMYNSAFKTTVSKYWKVFLYDSKGHKKTGYIEESILNSKIDFLV